MASRSRSRPRLYDDLVAFSDGSTAVMAAASHVIFRDCLVAERVRAHRSIWNDRPSWLQLRFRRHDVRYDRAWCPDEWNATVWPTFATPALWELLGVLLSLDSILAIIDNGDLIDCRSTTRVTVYCDNINVASWCVNGSDECRRAGASHVVYLVDLVQDRAADIATKLGHAVSFLTPSRGRWSTRIEACDTILVNLRSRVWSRALPRWLEAVDGEAEVALNQGITEFAYSSYQDRQVMCQY